MERERSTSTSFLSTQHHYACILKDEEDMYLLLPIIKYIQLPFELWCQRGAETCSTLDAGHGKGELAKAAQLNKVPKASIAET